MREQGTSLIWITHDLSVVAGLADDVAVMYAGQIGQIPGMAPDLLSMPAGCAFAARCARASALCATQPQAMQMPRGRMVRCFHPGAADAQ